MTNFVKIKTLRGTKEIENLYNIIKHIDCYICGGYVRYMCSPINEEFDRKKSDLDIYCKNNEEFEKLKIALKAFKFSIKSENDIAVSYKLKNGNKYKLVPRIQVIKPMIKDKIITEGDLETILTNFDFTIIRCGLIDLETALVDEDFNFDEYNRKLVLKNIHYPVSSMFRCIKYTKRGYYLSPIEALKLFLDYEQRTDEYKKEINDLFNENYKVIQKERIEKRKNYEKLTQIVDDLAHDRNIDTLDFNSLKLNEEYDTGDVDYDSHPTNINKDEEYVEQDIASDSYKDSKKLKIDDEKVSIDRLYMLMFGKL